ncbi:hypothetical protein SALBM311S_07613 [Streptomyces alboniger]
MHGAALRGDEVDHMPEPSLVLEGQVRRVVQVDVRLRGPVDHQGPGPGPLAVGDQLGESAVDALDDGLVAGLPAPAVPGLSHGAIIGVGLLSGAYAPVERERPCLHHT